MNKLAKLIANGDITVEELASATELIERARFVTEGIEACKKTLSFGIGVKRIKCYNFTDSFGEYHAWGDCTSDGIFTCYCNWGGDHEIGRCNLMDFAEVFMAFENKDFASSLRNFLCEQIDKAR